MTILVMALYAEGSVDARFLPPLVRRTAEIIIARYGRKITDIPEPIIIPKKHDKLDKCIYQAAIDAKDFHALVVHNDGDNLSYNTAKERRFDPGFSLVQQSSEEICQKLVPVIPVRMIEAWMLADFDALCQVLGTTEDAQRRNQANRVTSVENIAKPKESLNEVVRAANASRSRRRPISLNTKYELLARQIDLDKLFEVPSYREFVSELAKTLEDLHFIPYGSASKIASNIHFSHSHMR